MKKTKERIKMEEIVQLAADEVAACDGGSQSQVNAADVYGKLYKFWNPRMKGKPERLRKF